jgi:hypothetical protein
MAAKVRLVAAVEPEVAEQVKQLAADMDTSVARLLGVLLTIAIQTSGATFEAFAADIERLKGAAEK